MKKPFQNNSSKDNVRLRWNTPVLQYLHKQYGVKYRYMGLPGIDLIDIKLWRDMIDHVVAFEPLGGGSDGRANVEALRKNMMLAGIPGYAYLGSMEEVIIQRRDFDYQKYSQDKVVTLYNLDFCDEIGSRVSTFAGTEKVLRFEAIKQILRDQKECFQTMGGSSHFILLITVRNQIDALKKERFLKKGLLSESQKFKDKCEAINALPVPAMGPLGGKYSWAIKTFMYDLLCKGFQSPHISSLFFPLYLYQGTPLKSGGMSPMIHWMILCRFENEEEHSPEFYPDSFLEISSVGDGRDGLLNWKPQTAETIPIGMPPGSLKWLQTYGQNMLNGFNANSPAKVKK